MVAAGGATGALARFGISSLVERVAVPWFPLGTLAVNVMGCLVLGAISGHVHTREDLSEPVRLLVVVGVLGSFTTFSTFAGETVVLAREGRMTMALANVALSLVAGLGSMVIGWWIGQQLSR